MSESNIRPGDAVRPTPGRGVALVTGASRGIGRAIAVGLAEDGYDVVVNYASSRGAAEEVVGEIAARGRRGLAVRADVGVADDRTGLVAAAVEAFGRIDVLVNNAGITSPGRTDLLDVREESFDRVLAINLKGPFFLAQAVARQMIAQPPPIGPSAGDDPSGPTPDRCRGTIVNIGSVSAWAVSSNRADYCLAKAALTMMTRVFAERLARDGLRVYEVQPGVIATDMTDAVREKYDRLIAEGAWPIARWGRPGDVARAVRLLARGELAYSTGDTLRVDGGFHIRRL